MVVVGTTSGERTLLQAVNLLFEEIGESRVGTVMSPTKRINNAVAAVKAGRDECYYRKMWEFRRGYLSLTLVASQMWYELPTDYHEMASFLSRNSNAETIPFLAFDALCAMWPEMRIFPPSAGMATISSALQAAAQTNNFGTPKYYTVWNGYIGMMPVPDATFVADEGSLYATYWRQAPEITGDGDDIGLPKYLWNAQHKLSLAQFKKYVEYADWASDKQDGLRLLALAVNGGQEAQDADIYHVPGINYNE